MAKYCPQCGAKVQENDKFCAECGAILLRQNGADDVKPTETNIEKEQPVKRHFNVPDQQTETNNEKQQSVKRHFNVPDQQPARHFNVKPAAEDSQVKKEKPQVKPEPVQPVKNEEKVPKKQSVTEKQLFMEEKPAKKEKKHLFAKMDRPSGKAVKNQKAPEPVVKEVEIKEPKKKKKKRFRLGKLIIRLLVLAILIEGVYMVMVDPGIEEIRQTIYEFRDGKEYDPEMFVSADIDPGAVNITFSDAEVAKAKENRAVVTEKKTSASFGNIKVEMSPYNLLGGDDELIVKSLGTKQDENSGCSIEAYDFALASGRNEFCYHVVIDFPVEKNDDNYTEFVYYNESSKKWEALYYELSEDGKHYHVYIDHFTKVGKQQRLFNLKKPLVRNTSELERLMEQKGITLDMFFECRTAFVEDHMLYNVHMDTSLLLDKMKNDTIKSVGQVVNNFHNQSMSLKRAFEALNNEKVEKYSEYSGYVEAGMTMNEMTEFVFKDSKALSNLGLALSAVDFSLALFNIADEISLNPETTTLDLWRKRWSELITMGTAATAVLTLSGPVAVQFAALSLAWYFGTYCYDQLQKIDEYNPDSKEIEWRFYDYYLHPNHNVNVTKDHRYKTDLDGIMKKPSSMSDEEFKIFVKDMKKEPGLRSGDPKYWMPAFKSILRIYRNEPERVPGILDELYENFANAYFDLSKKERTKWQEEASRKLAIDIREYTPLGRLETRETVKAMKQKMQIMTAETLMQAYKDFEYDLLKEFRSFVREKIDKPMNSIVYFYVVDDSLGKDQDFTKSRYYVDYTKLEENQNFIKNRKYNKVTTPMKFAGVTKPLFIPMQSSGEKGSKKYYYPYQDNFLPKINPDGMVFKCTLFHWMMMGSPAQMIFRDVNSEVETDLIASVSSVSGNANKTTMTIHVNPGLTLDPYLGIWQDTNKRGYVALAYQGGKVVYYEGSKLDPGKEWVVVDSYNIDPKTKVLTLYSEKFVGPAKLTLVDENTISMPDQKLGTILKLKRVQN